MCYTTYNSFIVFESRAIEIMARTLYLFLFQIRLSVMVPSFKSTIIRYLILI